MRALLKRVNLKHAAEKEKYFVFVLMEINHDLDKDKLKTSGK